MKRGAPEVRVVPILLVAHICYCELARTLSKRDIGLGTSLRKKKYQHNTNKHEPRTKMELKTNRTVFYKEIVADITTPN